MIIITRIIWQQPYESATVVLRHESLWNIPKGGYVIKPTPPYKIKARVMN